MKTLHSTVREALSLIINTFGNDLTHFLWAETVSYRPLNVVLADTYIPSSEHNMGELFALFVFVAPRYRNN